MTARKEMPLPRILLVDDERDVLSTLEMGLRINEFSVTGFTDPVSVVSDFVAGIFDLALLDVKMPKLTGFELYMKLRQKDPGIKVCFLTAFEAFDEFKKLFPEMDEKNFLQKPISIRDLINQINSILDNDQTTSNENGTKTG